MVGLAYATGAALLSAVLGGRPIRQVLGLSSLAIHLGFATGALMDGLVVDAAGVSPLWMLAVACRGAGLIRHKALTREVQP